MDCLPRLMNWRLGRHHCIRQGLAVPGLATEAKLCSLLQEARARRTQTHLSQDKRKSSFDSQFPPTGHQSKLPPKPFPPCSLSLVCPWWSRWYGAPSPSLLPTKFFWKHKISKENNTIQYNLDDYKTMVLVSFRNRGHLLHKYRHKLSQTNSIKSWKSISCHRLGEESPHIPSQRTVSRPNTFPLPT